jgi:hypothetical protein
VAKNETKAVVVLTAGEPIKVRESVEAIRGLIVNAPHEDPQFIKVVDARGVEHWINLSEIVEFHEYEPREPFVEVH